MALHLRPTGLSSQSIGGEFVVGYEDRHTRDELRWYWAINGVHAGPSVIKKDGRTATLDEAKAEFAKNWHAWLAWAGLKEIE